MKYIIEISDASVRKELEKVCSKVGKPQAIPELVIVETEKSKEDLLAIPGVLYVEEPGEDNVDNLELSKQGALNQQTNVENWFLPSVSGIKGNEYHFPNKASGVDIYIMDSGIRLDHEEFGGRVETIFSYDGKDYGGDVRSPQHGTMCAGCAGGWKHGTAKSVKLYNCRYNFTHSEGLKVLDTILKHHINKEDDRPSILSMSFSSRTPSHSYNISMRKLIDAGVVCIAAAGNNRENEVRYPAGYTDVMAIGALRKRFPNDPLSVGPASYTNYGTDLTMWAPGHAGTVANYREKDELGSASGTSAACPVVAGIMAMLLDGSAKLTSREEVKRAISLLTDQCTKVEFAGKYSESTTNMVSSVFLLPIFKEKQEPVPAPKPAPEPKPVPEPVPEPKPAPKPEPEPKPPVKEKTKWYKKKQITIATAAVVISLVLFLIL